MEKRGIAMIGVESKLYQVITVTMQVVFLSIICFVMAIPIFTLPLAVLLYCQIGGNIVSDRKLLHCSNLNKKKIIPIILFVFLGICSLYSSLMLTQMKDFFISRLIIALILSFNIAAGIFVLHYEKSFFINIRNAFFYVVANLHKTILPVFLFIGMMGKLNGMLSGYAVSVIFIVGAYFLFKINYKAIEKNFASQLA